MPKNQTIHEGVKKAITITIDSNSASTLNGKEVTIYAFFNKGGVDEEIELGSETISGTDIEFVATDTHLLDANKQYKIEAWVEPDLNSRQCVFPEDDEDFYLIVKDREKI